MHPFGGLEREQKAKIQKPDHVPRGDIRGYESAAWWLGSFLTQALKYRILSKVAHGPDPPIPFSFRCK